MDSDCCVVAISDNTHLPYSLVLFAKLRKLGNPHQFFLLTTNIAEAEIIEELIKLNVEIVEIDNLLFERQKLNSSRHVSEITYAKFFIPSVLPIQYSKALYLDLDIYIEDNLVELIRTPMQSTVMACQDLDNNFVIKNDGKVISNYFNAGVFLINLSQARDMKLQEQFDHLFSKYGALVHQDQDYLNIIFEGQWSPLSPKYNIFVKHVIRKNAPPLFNDAHIYHFVGKFKPWNTRVFNKFYLLWQSDYVNMVNNRKLDFTYRIRSRSDFYIWFKSKGLTILAKKLLPRQTIDKLYFFFNGKN